jgi:hypothetical protein
MSAKHIYRIDLHGPYRRHILVRDGLDVRAYSTRAEAENALASLRAEDAQSESALISRGTEIAFAVGEKTHRERGGCAPGLRQCVTLHRANIASAGEAGTAATTKIGAVHEHAVGAAETPSLSPGPSTPGSNP